VVLCAECGYYLAYQATHCPYCGSLLSRQLGQGQDVSEPNPGLQPIVLSGTAGNLRLRRLAEASQRVRGEAPSGFHTAATVAPKTHPMRWVIVLGLVAAIALASVVLGPGLLRSVSAARAESAAGPSVFSRAPATSAKPALPAGQILPPSATADQAAIMVNPAVEASVPLVVEYFDYQCPACRATDQVFGARLADLASKGVIRLEFHAMTFLDDNLRNDSSTRAAVAAACADTVGAYGSYHRVIYANQPAKEGAGYLDIQLRNSFAASAGINGPRLQTFQKCYDSRATATFVAGVDQAAKNAGVRSTPTLRFNGKDIRNQLDYNDVSSLDRVLGTSGR
jgi:protein-disulfide isomerase